MVDEERARDTFARKLRAARAYTGMSQQELADKAGVGRGVISSYETGARLPAGVMSAANICYALGISLDEALGL